MLNRRHVLLGATGFTLGLPIMRSLMPRTAKAQDIHVDKFFCHFFNDHGAINESAMFPADSLLTEEVEFASGHTIKRGDLQLGDVDGKVGLCRVLSAASDRMTESMAARMNVLRGLDIPFYISHHTSGTLGNYNTSDGRGGPKIPTIDQLLAWSPNFYSDLGGITERSINFDYRGETCYNWSSPSTREGSVTTISSSGDPSTVFRKVFLPEEEEDGPEPRPLVVDRVMESYMSLRQSDRRLSTADRQRLDDHMDRLYELERRLTTTTVRPAACGQAEDPGRVESNQPGYYQAYNDVAVAAFLCGTCRVAVSPIRQEHFSDFSGDWHQDVAHQARGQQQQEYLQASMQSIFENVVLDLAYKLDVEIAEGVTILDNALLHWSQESGPVTHDSWSIPVVTLGSAGGAISTGNYCDYRRMTSAAELWDGIYAGLLYSQWLATMLMAFGLTRDEFQDIPENAETGYGQPIIDDPYIGVYVDRAIDEASEPLPFIGT